jgi:hypothetical protein
MIAQPAQPNAGGATVHFPFEHDAAKSPLGVQ